MDRSDFSFKSISQLCKQKIAKAFHSKNIGGVLFFIKNPISTKASEELATPTITPPLQ